MPVLHSRALAFLSVVALFAAACGDSGGSSPTPTPEDSPGIIVPTSAPNGDRVQLETSVTTEYYTVHGLTTKDIFTEIDNNGLTDSAGRKAIGLTTTHWSYSWSRSGSSECSITSMSIDLNLVVSLPRHEKVNDLPETIRAKWQSFAAGVAAHEQRHVDIALSGARRLRDDMASISGRSSCSALEEEVKDAWSRGQEKITEDQNRFHLDEDGRLAALRRPLETQIGANRSRMSDLEQRIRAMDRELDGLNSQVAALDLQIAQVKAELDSLDKTYPGAKPPEAQARYEELREQYNDLVRTRNTLANQYNNKLEERKNLAAEHDNLLEATNALVETYNWTR
jgi:predicted secreted Zn-dependent protease